MSPVIRRLLVLLGLAALPLLAACETAPGTGRSIFTGGMSAADETRLGYREHQKIVPQFGGAYADTAVTGYVASIGNLLARTSETPDTKFTFTVLDTPIARNRSWTSPRARRRLASARGSCWSSGRSSRVRPW